MSAHCVGTGSKNLCQCVNSNTQIVVSHTVNNVLMITKVKNSGFAAYEEHEKEASSKRVWARGINAARKTG